MELNEISGMIVDAAMGVHSVLGPGLLEHVYKACLAHELRKRGLQVEVPLPVMYDGLQFDLAYRMDLLVEGSVIVELKSIESVLPIHKAQLLSYLRLSEKQLGLLINFNVVHLRHGIHRVVNRLDEKSSAASASSAL